MGFLILGDKEITYLSENKRIILNFSISNFMHLTGIEYDKGNIKFFHDAKENKLERSKIKFKADGTTTLKLDVLEHIKKLLTDEIELLDGGFTLKMSYDNAIRTKKILMALMLKNIKGISKPQSLFNLKTTRKLKHGEKVKEIYSKYLKTGEVTRIL